MYPTALSIKIYTIAVTPESFFIPLPISLHPKPSEITTVLVLFTRLGADQVYLFLEFYVSRIIQCCVLFCALSGFLNSANVSEIRCMYLTSFFFFCLVVLHCMSTSQFVYPFSFQWTCGLFQFGASVSKVAMNIPYKYLFLQVYMREKSCWVFSFIKSCRPFSKGAVPFYTPTPKK